MRLARQGRGTYLTPHAPGPQACQTLEDTCFPPPHPLVHPSLSPKPQLQEAQLCQEGYGQAHPGQS